MEEKLSMVKELLAKYGQEHLLQCYDKFSDEQKNKLLDDILTLDFNQVQNLYESTKTKRLITHAEYIKNKEKQTNDDDNHWHDKYEHDIYNNV